MREEQITQIDKMLLCNDPSKGFFYYNCDCGEHYTRHFRCNSRCCNRCGTSYVNQWAERTTKRLLKVKHSHIIFTMPDSLWELVKDNFDCIKELSSAVYQTITEVMGKVRHQVVIPGMISSLHTFGEDMKYNVHFHTIVTQGGMSKKYNQWLHIDYLPYEILRKKWKALCLEVITKHAEKTFDNQYLLENLLYFQHHNGYNVRVIKTDIPRKELVQYIARYIRHPPISNRRIVGYDGKTVIIVCGEKKNRYYVSLSVDEFITRLTWHIPQKNYKMIRHFGLYSRPKYGKVPVEKDKQESIMNYFHSKNAAPCPKCGKINEPVEYFPPTLPIGPPDQKVIKKRITDW